VALNQKVLVSGGSGRLELYVVERLKLKHDVTVLDRLPPVTDGVTYANVDVTDLPGLTKAFDGIQAVVHLAAVPNPRTSTPQECFKINTLGTWTVLQAAEDAKVSRVVVASSDSAVGLNFNPENWAPLYLPVDEQHPLRPSEVYSLTKEITESIARSFSVRGKAAVLVRRPSHVVFRPEYPELRTRGTDLHNYHLWGYVAPEDVAQAFELAIQLEDGSYDCFYIGARDGLNDRPTLELFKERFGYEAKVRRPEVYAALPNAGIFDISHAERKLGYKPQILRSDFTLR
jgi:UDP-glucose 4-epimerase